MPNKDKTVENLRWIGMESPVKVLWVGFCAGLVMDSQAEVEWGTIAGVQKCEN